MLLQSLVLVSFSHKLAWKKSKNRLYSVFTSTGSVFTKKEIKCLIQQTGTLIGILIILSQCIALTLPCTQDDTGKQD